MAHLHEIRDDDARFTVEPESKTIIYSDEYLPILCKGDHNSELFTFEIPRYIEEHDVLECNLAQIHFINLSAVNGALRSNGVYEITDMRVDPEDENLAICTWKISGAATMHEGSLNFILRLACMSGSKIDYSWNTSVYSGITVVESIDNAGLVADQYRDVLETWYMELVASGVMGVNIVDDAKNQALAAITEAEKAAKDRLKEIPIINEVEQETIDRINKAGEDLIAEMQKILYAGEIEVVE